MKLQLENLSVEELKILHKDINLLLKNKYKPKYEKDTYFINPKDLSFFHIRYSDYHIDNSLFYQIEISTSDGNTISCKVEESFIDKCFSISKKVYISLLDYKNEFMNKTYDFIYKQDIERSNYQKSLINEFENKLQEVINEYKK